MERTELLRVGKALIDALPSDLVKQFDLHEGTYLKIDTSVEGFTLKRVFSTKGTKTLTGSLATY